MHRARLLAVVALLIALFAPVSSKAGAGNYPILLVHGWTSSGSTFDEMIPKLTAQGLTVLDCDSSKAGR